MLATATATPGDTIDAELAQNQSASEKSHVEDEALMQRVAAGDESAQRIVARRMVPVVRRVARSLTRNPSDADDATQASLMEILRSAGTYRGVTTIERWSQRIIVRTTLRQIREQRRLYSVVDSSTDVADVGTPAREIHIEALPRSVQAYLNEITDVQREAIVLRHAFGYTVAEVAELTGVTENTAKARLLYGRRSLRRLVRRDVAIGARKDADS